MSLEPNRSCRYEIGDAVAILGTLGESQDWGRVTTRGWNGNGSDIGWRLRVVTPSGRHYICHEGDLQRDQRSAVDQLGGLTGA